jgi:hypothetical protein
MRPRPHFRQPTLRIIGTALAVVALLAPKAALASAIRPGPPALTVTDAGQLDAAAARRLDELRAAPGNWGWRELVDRGRVAVAQGEFPAAAMAFEAAFKAAPTDAERAMSAYCWASALIASAQSLPGVKGAENPARRPLLVQAGNLLNEVQRDVPQSREVAAARLSAWSLLGDELETTAAEHQLRVIDPALEGNPRCDLVTIGIVALVVFVSGRYVLKTFEFEGYLEPKQRLALLSVFDTGARVTGALLGGRAIIDVFTTEVPQ